MSARSPRKPSAPDRVPPASARPATTRRGLPTWGWVTLIVVLGVAVRLVSVSLAPGRAYPSDHLDAAAWSEFIFTNGPLRAYDLSERGLINTRLVPPRVPQPMTIPFPHPHPYAYPPGSAYLFWMQGLVWRVVEPTPETLQLSPAFAAQLGVPPQQVTSRVADTFQARFANAFPSAVFDFLMAWGVACIVRVLREPQRRNTPSHDRTPSPGHQAGAAGGAGFSDWPVLVAFALAVLAPPIFLDSAYWNQTDAPVTCLLVWCVYGLIAERFWLAGLFFGLAAAVKPQAILLGPVLAFVFLALRFRAGGTWGAAVAMAVKSGLAAALAFAAIAGPTALADARSPSNTEGPWRWFRLGYFWTVVEKHPQTTLNAYNVWWLDFLARGATRDALSESATLLGVPKGPLGKGLLVAAIVASWWLCARRWRWGRESWLACAFLVCLAAFLFPTRVHERYIYYCIPFLIAAVFIIPAWIPSLVALLIVGTASMTWFQWYDGSDQKRLLTGLFAVLTVGAFAYALLTLALQRPTGAAARSAGTP